MFGWASCRFFRTTVAIRVFSGMEKLRFFRNSRTDQSTTYSKLFCRELVCRNPAIAPNRLFIFCLLKPQRSYFVGSRTLKPKEKIAVLTAIIQVCVGLIVVTTETEGSQWSVSKLKINLTKNNEYLGCCDDHHT